MRAALALEAHIRNTADLVRRALENGLAGNGLPAAAPPKPDGDTRTWLG